MYYQQNLRSQLQQRRIRLYKAVDNIYQNELKYLLTFIQATPYLRGLVQELMVQHPEVDSSSWRAAHFGDRRFVLPDSEGAAAKVCYGLIGEMAESEEADAACRFAWSFTDSSADGAIRYFTEVFVDPFINYLHNKVDEGSNVLYFLEKYKRRTEWFHREELLNRVRSDSRQSEASVDRHLREYLFDQGVDYPFSTPHSPSGRADVVADVGEDQLLVMEVKLFDLERSYDRSYIRQGFRQIHDYAADYGQSVGYLVIFNCSPQTLVFRTSVQNRLWPPRIELDHKTFFLIVIDLVVPEQSASQRGALQPYVIEESYLVVPPEDSDGSQTLTAQ